MTAHTMCHLVWEFSPVACWVASLNARTVSRSPVPSPWLLPKRAAGQQQTALSLESPRTNGRQDEGPGIYILGESTCMEELANKFLESYRFESFSIPEIFASREARTWQSFPVIVVGLVCPTQPGEHLPESFPALLVPVLPPAG